MPNLVLLNIFALHFDQWFNVLQSLTILVTAPIQRRSVSQSRVNVAVHGPETVYAERNPKLKKHVLTIDYRNKHFKCEFYKLVFLDKLEQTTHVIFNSAEAPEKKTCLQIKTTCFACNFASNLYI